MIQNRSDRFKCEGEFMRIMILPENQAVEASQNMTVLEALVVENINIDHSCGGMGSCGTCRIFIFSGDQHLQDPTEPEIEIAQDRGFAKNERLSCQSVIRNESGEIILSRSKI